MAKSATDFMHVKSQILPARASYSQCLLLAFEQLGLNWAQNRQNHGPGHKVSVTLAQTVAFDPSLLNSWLCFVLLHPVEEEQVYFIYPTRD